MIYIITYDLKTEDKDYATLFDGIKSLGDNFHVLGSTWLLSSDLPVNNLAEQIRRHMDEKDNLFVVNITGKERQGWLPKTAWQWLKDKESK